MTDFYHLTLVFLDAWMTTEGGCALDLDLAHWTFSYYIQHSHIQNDRDSTGEYFNTIFQVRFEYI